MAQTLYYPVNFVTLHQKAPTGVDPGLNSGNQYLEINGVQRPERSTDKSSASAIPAKIPASPASIRRNGRLALPLWSGHPT